MNKLNKLNKLRMVAASLLVAGTLGAAAPVNAAPAEQGRSEGCFQTSTGPGGATSGGPQSNPSSSDAVLVGVIAAAVQNVSVLDNVQNVLTNVLSGANVELICLNDVLNQNDIRILQDILNESPILNNNLNDSLNNNEVLKNFLNNNNVAANVEVISVRALTGTGGSLFLLRQ
jgi:hypothetical protein